MRSRAVRLSLLTLPSLLACVACGDSAPIYPPIVIIVQGGGASGVPSPNGGGNDGSGANANPQGGSSGKAGSSGSAGGGQVPTGPLAHCSTFVNGPEPKVQTACDLDKLTDGGELKGDIAADRTLKGGKFYTLKGSVRVLPGKTLTIEPCVKVIGENSDAVLAVLAAPFGNPKDSCKYPSNLKPASTGPGGKLVAVGEPMAPIIFTSARPVGQRAPGDWGGVLLLGNAQNDRADPDFGTGQSARARVEGLSTVECHGYHASDFNTESSGNLSYVRIEYASRKFGADSETNGLTLASVGSGTELHYVEVSNSADDCFEWFGGTVNADHLIALNCDDDAFDGDEGYSGKLQFLFGRQGPISTENDPRGLEISQGPGFKSILTAEQLSNVTLCGNKSADSREHGGADFNEVPMVQVMNLFITGFSSYGIQARNGTVNIDYARLFDQLPLFSVDGSSAFARGMGNGTELPDRFCNCWANPPAPVPATPVPGGKPSGFPDDKANYVGAFADASASSNWMRGLWVDWADK